MGPGPESRRPESKQTGIQSPVDESPSIQTSSVQECRVQAYRRTESKHPDNASRVQIFRYAEICIDFNK